LHCAAAGSSAARLCSGIGKRGLGAAGEKVERSFAFTLDRGGLRRAHLRGRANVQKRYFIHVAGYNLGLVMRQLIGAGTLKRLATRAPASSGCSIPTSAG
jgi:transposase